MSKKINLQKFKNKIMNKNEFKAAIRNIYTAVDGLKKVFPGRKFTLDGKIVGDIGEAIAATLYQVNLYDKNRRDWDGWWKNESGDREEVQIRATQCDTTYLKKPPQKGTLLLFKIDKEKMGEYSVVYNGDIMLAWNAVKHQKNKDKIISLKKLKKLQKDVSSNDKIPKR